MTPGAGDVHFGTEVRERRSPIALVGGGDGDHLRIHRWILRSDVDVRVGVAGREHHHDVLAVGVDDGVAHARVIAVHLPRAVDDVAARAGVQHGLIGDVVDRVGAILVHAGRQIDAERHQPAAVGDADHPAAVAKRGDRAGHMRAMLRLVLRHLVRTVGEVPVLGATRQDVGGEVGVIQVAAGVDDGDHDMAASHLVHPRFGRVDVAVRGADSAVDVLPGVVETPQACRSRCRWAALARPIPRRPR